MPSSQSVRQHGPYRRERARAPGRAGRSRQSRDLSAGLWHGPREESESPEGFPKDRLERSPGTANARTHVEESPQQAPAREVVPAESVLRRNRRRAPCAPQRRALSSSAPAEPSNLRSFPGGLESQSASSRTTRARRAPMRA